MSRLSRGRARVRRFLRHLVCPHVFRASELRASGIREPLEPSESATYEDWRHYAHAMTQGEHVMRRVRWPCARCRRVFYAQCGHTILNGRRMIDDRALAGGRITLAPPSQDQHGG